VGKKRAAFTLFEIVLVCALIALLAAILVPNLDAFHADARILAAGDMVKGQLAQTRSHAIEEGRPYRFEILDATHCRVVPDNGEAPAPGNAGAAGDNGEGTPGEDTLPKHVSFDLTRSNTTNSDDPSTDSASGGSGLKIVFLPDGRAREDAEIRLTSPGARSLTLQLRGLTATITTGRSKEGNGP
jgi:Tfp pilus assembly protein FimT